MSNIALLLAGGQGLRMGTDVAKQFLPLFDKPVLMYSLLSFQKHAQIDAIYIVCHADWQSQLQVLFEPAYNLSKLKAIVVGGTTRKQSSYLGLKEVAKSYSPNDIVLIHDVARPLVSERVITDNIHSAKKYGACTTAIPVSDTILVSDNQKLIQSVPDRQTMFAAQTPQSFMLSIILAAHMAFEHCEDATDDTALLIRQGLSVALVNGDKQNLKITTPEDLEIIKEYLKKANK